VPLEAIPTAVEDCLSRFLITGAEPCCHATSRERCHLAPSILLRMSVSQSPPESLHCRATPGFILRREDLAIDRLPLTEFGSSSSSVSTRVTSGTSLTKPTNTWPSPPAGRC
jgi:hypothetical protein